MQAGLTGKLHANVALKIGEPTGDPKRYPVSLTVSFGGAVAGSGGAGKKPGSKGSASMEIKGSLEKSMTVTHVLGEAELAGYVKSLEAASQGSKVAATYNEFAIIAAGAKANDWGVARQMWQGISKDTAVSLTHAGDSVEVSEKKSVGVAVEGRGGAVGVGYGVAETDENSKKLTRKDGGTLDVEGKGAHTKQKSKSVSMSAGVAGVSVGATHTQQTRFGFAIEVDPKDDPDRRMLDALGKCSKKADYQAFLAAHPKARMVSQTDGKTDAESTEAGISLGGKTVLTFGTGQRVDEDTKTDARGKVLAKRVAGHATAGGKLGGLADSLDEDAVAEIDGDGNAALTMTRTSKDNYGGRSRDKLARKVAAKLTGKGGDNPMGALAALAGSDDDDDNATHDVSGIKLNNKDLKRLGGVACRSMLAWMGVPRRTDEKDDWKKAGLAIAQAKALPSVVAEQLARFVGGDRVERMKTVELFIRGGHQQTTGHAFEFPDSLRDVREDYDLVTDDKLDEKMNTYANKSGDAAAAEECRRLLAIVDRIQPRLQACNDFDNIATKMEMLHQLLDNRSMLARGIKGYGGDLQADKDPTILADEGDRLLKQCNDYAAEQRRLTAKLQDQDAYTVSERAAGKRLIKQLEDLQYRWTGDYERLKLNHGKRNTPFIDMPAMRPQEELIATFEKKFRR
jgi:hypothetical protein